MGNNQTTDVANKLQNLGHKIKENINENIAKPVNNSNLKVMLKGQKKKGSVGGGNSQQLGEEEKNRNIYQGIKIEFDPMEREIYVKCPLCSLKVFDSGLQNELYCESCNLLFNGGKRYTEDQLKEMRLQQNQYDEQERGGDDDEEDEENNQDLEDDEEENERNQNELDQEQYEKKQKNREEHQQKKVPVEDIKQKGQSNSESESIPNRKSSQRRSVQMHQQQKQNYQAEMNPFELISLEQEKTEKKQFLENQEEEKKELLQINNSANNSPQRNKSIKEINPYQTPISQSQQQSQQQQQMKQQQRRSDASFNNTKSTQMATPGSAIQNNPTNSRQQNRYSVGGSNAIQGSSSEESSKYVNELEDVIIFLNKDTIIEDFKDEKSVSGVNLALISKTLLMPFFQIRSRILEKGTYFQIGTIEFYVASCEPYEFGKVTAKSIIRCTQAVSKNEPLQRINLAPLRRLDTSRTILMENVIKPYFESRLDTYLHKNQVIEIDDYEFYVKYSRPFFGKVSNGTEVKIDSSTPKRIQVIRLAPIWDNEAKQEEILKNKGASLEKLKEAYLNPYFLCGFICYVEKGETILIDNQEFFVNDCKPKSGLVDKQTLLELEVGFTRDVFKRKQVLADQRLAEKFQQREGHQSIQRLNRHSLGLIAAASTFNRGGGVGASIPFNNITSAEDIEAFFGYDESYQEQQNLQPYFERASSMQNQQISSNTFMMEMQQEENKEEREQSENQESNNNIEGDIREDQESSEVMPRNQARKRTASEGQLENSSNNNQEEQKQEGANNALQMHQHNHPQVNLNQRSQSFNSNQQSTNNSGGGNGSNNNNYMQFRRQVIDQYLNQYNAGRSANQRELEYQNVVREMMLQQQQYEEIYQRIQQKTHSTPKSIINCLPERQLTKDYLEKVVNDDSLKKCMICMEEYQEEESIRTMPCLHYFHTVCIDKWLSRGKICPICKFDIKKNYNAVQLESLEQIQGKGGVAQQINSSQQQF